MPKVAKELTDLAVRKLSAPGRHMVGGVAGLNLQITPTGARSWRLLAMVGGKRREMGLGSYPEVSLKDAREAARRARNAIKDGRDPIGERQAARQAIKAATEKLTTFRQAADAFLSAHEAGWKNPKHRQQWENTLESYAYPVIGDLAVGDIELAHILKILEPIWTDKTETATRVRGRIEQILDAASARGQIDAPWQNPARWRGLLDKLLPAPTKLKKVQHHKALPVDEVAAFMTRLKSQDGMGARAVEFAILTAARSGEVRGATWAEIDLDKALWVVPADRMKMKREHRVPLSSDAVALLKALPRIAGSPYVFPAARGGMLSDMTLSAVTRRMKVEAVPHGFRSTFRDWTAERTAYPSEVCEMALAHAVGNKVEAAYRRGDMFDRRRRLMDDWAAFLKSPPAKGNVTPIRGAA